MKQQTFLDYDGFVEKFKPRKTTDDCYTPANIYSAVRDWAVREYQLAGREIVRPFWPGGDYEAFDYPPNCVVIDNPPFSILGKIVRHYVARSIDYFLFAPYLTNLGIGAGQEGVNHVIAPVSVTYENGAKVDTSFVTSLGEWYIRTAEDLLSALLAAEKSNSPKSAAQPRYEFPAAVITSAKVGYFCKHGAPFRIRRSECTFVRRLDAMPKDISIYGGGFLLSERAAAARAYAEGEVGS